MHNYRKKSSKMEEGENDAIILAPCKPKERSDSKKAAAWQGTACGKEITWNAIRWMKQFRGLQTKMYEKEGTIMFDNVGRKIKAWAKALCWVGIILSIGLGVAFILIGDSQGYYNPANLALSCTGAAWLVIGPVFSYIGSLAMYGLGELVENSDIRTELAIKKSMENERTETIPKSGGQSGQADD